ncbi:hypothetical protein ACYATP_07545 [Lactobacillaceae bacterium Melli_B4]
MKFKSMLITGAATISLLVPFALSTTNFNSNTAHADTQPKAPKSLDSVIPRVHSHYWFQWRHVILTKPLTVNLTEWYKNNLGGWDSRIAKSYQIPAGTPVYMTGYTTNFTIMTEQPKDANTYTGNQTVLRAKMTGTPNVKLVDDNYNTAVAILSYPHAKVKAFNNKKWHQGFYNNGGDEPSLLFKSLQQFKKYDKLADEMGDIGDGTDGDYDGLSKQELASIHKTTQKYNAAKKVATKFDNLKKSIQVKALNDEILMVKLNNRIYYTEGGASGDFQPYNIQNSAGTIQSNLNPTAKDHQFVIQKGQSIYLYQGEKWIGPHKWQYDGMKWVRNDHLKW